MKKNIAPTRLEAQMSPHEFSPRIGSSLKGELVVRKVGGLARKNFKAGIGQKSVQFDDDLTGGLVEEWNRVVDGARVSL